MGGGAHDEGGLRPVRSGASCGAGVGRSDLLQHRATKGVEPDAPDVEGATVEGLEVERVAFALLDLVAQLQPQALADLVAGRLARPAEVAVELEAEDLLVHEAVAG